MNVQERQAADEKIADLAASILAAERRLQSHCAVRAC